MNFNDKRMVYKSSSKERLMALVAYPSFLKLLDVKNKPYKVFLEWLLKDELKINDEDTRLPDIKDIAKVSGVDAQKIANYLKIIYDDIFELNDKEPEKFMRESQTLCTLYFKYVTYTTRFSLGLNKVPRKGELIDFSFIRPKIMGTMFYVERVDYYIRDNEQSILIDLDANKENLYLRLLREKAYLKGHISSTDSIDLEFGNNHSLKDKLVKMYQNL
ncbi:MAG TPA: hypothetical protein VK808_11580 [Bacteroidia bacterium]|jgi:hypothetical protein|nr:hypothetical protein [Bacteroidia bacterium]